jgi:hypothetical protein
MIQFTEPYSKQEILETFAGEYTAVTQFFTQFDQQTFFQSISGQWSPAENLQHLIQSCRPVILALNLPKTILRLIYGEANRPSTTFAIVRDRYINGALAGGGKASGIYIPKVSSQSSAKRRRILQQWANQEKRVAKALEKWSENDLDTHLLPHPLLGHMTVREILFFTLYHNMHHVNDVQRMRNQPVTEWFVQPG